MPVYDPRYPINSTANWYGGGAAGIMPPAHGVGPSYNNYFQQASWLQPHFFGGLDATAQGALQANPEIGYGHIAARVAPDPNSNMYRYLMAQANRLHSDYDYQTLAGQGQGSWLDYMGAHIPQLEQQFKYLSPQMRGESQKFAQGGGRYLG